MSCLLLNTVLSTFQSSFDPHDTSEKVRSVIPILQLGKLRHRSLVARPMSHSWEMVELGLVPGSVGPDSVLLPQVPRRMVPLALSDLSHLTGWWRYAGMKLFNSVTPLCLLPVAGGCAGHRRADSLAA